MILSVKRNTYNNKQSTYHQAVNRTSDTTSTSTEPITYDKYGHTRIFGINVGHSLLTNQFSEEDVKRWQQISQEQGPLKIIFDEMAGIEARTGYSTGMSMNFYDFCYLAEKGEMVNPQNSLSTREAKQQIQSKNWLTFFRYTTVYGKHINVQEAMAQLPILQRCYEIGLINTKGGLMRLDELQAALQQKGTNPKGTNTKRNSFQFDAFALQTTLLQKRTNAKRRLFEKLYGTEFDNLGIYHFENVRNAYTRSI